MLTLGLLAEDLGDLGIHIGQSPHHVLTIPIVAVRGQDSYMLGLGTLRTGASVRGDDGDRELEASPASRPSTPAATSRGDVQARLRGPDLVHRHPREGMLRA